MRERNKRQLIWTVRANHIDTDALSDNEMSHNKSNDADFAVIEAHAKRVSTFIILMTYHINQNSKRKNPFCIFEIKHKDLFP